MAEVDRQIVATVGFVQQQLSKILGVDATIPNGIEDNVINVEWLASAVRGVYSLIHIDIRTSYYTFLLSSSFSTTTSKKIVNLDLVMQILEYLRQFKRVCACDCNCDYTCNCCVQGNCTGNCGNETWGTDFNCDCKSNCNSNCSAADYNQGSYIRECTQVDTTWNCNCVTCSGSVNNNCKIDNYHCNCCTACDCGGNVPSVCSSNCNCSNCCFITSAVCKSFNKTDDCYELTMFRKFRDEWLKIQPIL